MPFDFTPMQPLEDSEVTKALIRGKAAIAKPRHWIKDAETSDDRSRYCAVGAVRWADNLPDLGVFRSVGVDRCKAIDVLQAIAFTHFGTSVERFNDLPRTKHRHIMILFDLAIAYSREKQSAGDSSDATDALLRFRAVGSGLHGFKL